MRYIVGQFVAIGLSASGSLVGEEKVAHDLYQSVQVES